MKKKEPAAADSLKMIAVNRKASHDYELIERFEAGLVLLGTEVKSARDGRVNLKDSYAAPR
ncbi:MAG TPA: SsrA-binding protein, partial [Vicinamibacteria bacterium]